MGFDADVAIVGYGPTGVSAANFLGARGVSAIAFERDEDIYQRARAVTVNDWTLRCFQSVGLDAALLADMDPHTVYRWKTFAGRELTRIEVPPSKMGQPSAMAIYQPVMERTLRGGAERFADRIEVRYGRKVDGIQQDADGVVVTAGGARTRVQYLLACDGGSSATRERLGIRLLGDTRETRWVVIDAKVKRWWPDRHILTFWSDRHRPVVDIPLALGNHRWEYPLAPDEREEDFASHDQLWRLLASMGVTHDDVEIHQHAFYRHHSRRAERWRDGRVFLLGDATHLMPPWAGQGMQSGIRDAFNIAWKLDLVLDRRLADEATERLLDSYEVERAPDVAFMTAVTEEGGRAIRMEMTGRQKASFAVAAVAGRLGLRPPSRPIGRPPVLVAGWLGANTGGRSAVGRMPPQPMMATPTGRRARLDDLIGSGFAWLGDDRDPAACLTESVRTEWERLGARFVAVRPVDRSSAADGDLIDLEGSLLPWMRRHGAEIVALRPDRFVCADGAAPRPPTTLS